MFIDLSRSPAFMLIEKVYKILYVDNTIFLLKNGIFNRILVKLTLDEQVFCASTVIKALPALKQPYQVDKLYSCCE